MKANAATLPRSAIAPPEKRGARLDARLAVFLVLAGFLAAQLGPQAACVVSSLGMFTVLGFAVLLTPLLRIR